jgi:Zinc dependent phospholipase C
MFSHEAARLDWREYGSTGQVDALTVFTARQLEPHSQTLKRPLWTLMQPRPWRAVLLICLLLCPLPGRSYSVLTHEQVVDLLWKDQIRPLLLQRYPNSSPDELRQAHAYAYGGCVIQDMGYYPFGNKYFSDLVHYVRSGDFVLALLKDASNLNEYAFALGALAHYASDNMGHPTINRVEPIEFPKLRKKYGDQVTYEDDPKSHIRTEFGFDMVQVAKNRYTSDRYHDFIGFEVSKPLLERAFLETYGLKLSDVLTHEDLAFGSYRRAVSIVIPEMTRVALLSRRDEIVKETPNFSRKKFLYTLSRTNYEKEWGKGYRKPGFGARILAFLLRIIPKVGPFKAVAFKIPSKQGEDLYIKSVNKTVDDYRTLLREVSSGSLALPNTDLDTGRPTERGEYKLADSTYARLVDDLSKQSFTQVSPALRGELLQFYSGANPPPSGHKKDVARWKKLQQQLDELRSSGQAAAGQGGTKNANLSP